MKKIQLFFKYLLLLTVGLWYGMDLSAQGNLLLVSGTDFSCSKKDPGDYFANINEVDGWLGFITPSSLNTPMSLVKSTKSTIASSDFLSKAQFAITPNSIRLDSLRMFDDEDWGFVTSTTTSGQVLLSMSVPGLKDGGNYRVEIDYFLPFTDAYMDKANKQVKPYINSYSAKIRAVVNPDTPQNQTAGDGTKGFDRNTNSGGDHETLIITNMSGQCGAISGGNLNLYISAQQGGLGQAIMIKSIKVYAEVDLKIKCQEGEKVCSGEQVTLSSLRSYNGVKYQWYKNGSAISGATSSSYVYDTPNDKSSAKFTLKVTAGGKEISSNTVTVENDKCCEVNGKPASRKIIYKDDFGEFDLAADPTGHTYKVMDYSKGIKDPQLVTKKTPDAFRYELDEAPLGCIYNLGDGKVSATEPVFDGGYTVAGVLTGYNGPAEGGYVGAQLGWAADLHGVKLETGHHYDHSGKLEGCALFINCKDHTKGQNIYYKEIPDLCENRQLYFSVAYSVFTVDGQGKYNPVDITIELEEMGNSDNKVSWRGTATSAKYGGSGTWEHSAELPIYLEQGTGVILRVINNLDTDQNGNDLVLDDIVVKACAAPSIKAYYDLSTFDEDTITCKGEDIWVYAKPTELLTNYFGGEDNTFYLYQYTTTPKVKTSWKNYGSLTKDLKKDVSGCPIFEEDLDTDDIVYFRVIAGGKYTMENTAESDFNEDDPCASYAISDAIPCVIDCPKCTEPKDPIIKAAGDGRIDLTGDVKTVHLCQGESVTLSSNDVMSKDQHDLDYKNFKITFHRGSKKNTPLTAENSGTVAKDLVVSWDDADKNGTSYILKVHDNFEVATTKCDKLDSIIIYADTIPVAPTVEIPAYCEGLASENSDVVSYLTKLALSLTGYGVEIVGPNGDVNLKAIADELDGLKAADSPVKYTITLTDKETKCVSDPKDFEVIINEIPDKPTVKDLDEVMDEGKSLVIKDAAKADGTNTLEWVETTKDGNEPTSGYSTTVPTVSLNEEADYYFYVRQVSEEGCIGEGEKVKVSVTSSPMPIAIDTIVCLNSDVDLNDMVQTTDDIYELRWYASEGKPDGTGDTDAPSVKTNKASEQKFYVTQRSTQYPNPESKMKEVTVTVLDVDVPDTTGNVYHYCAGDDAVDLKAKLVKDQANFFYADELHWSLDGGAETDRFTAVNTDVKETTTYEYSVYQTYTINNVPQETCKGNKLTWKVEVTFVPELETSQVTYMRADADGSGNFSKNLMQQSSNEVINGYDNSMNLLWFEENCEDMIGNGKTAPTPQVDVNGEAGVDQERTYCVKQQIDGCLSKGTKVDVIISDAPKPLITDYVYCRGIKSDKLTTKPDQSIKPDAVYVLKWYGNGEKGDYTNLNISGDEGPNPITSMRAGDNGKSEYYYYVTQTEMVDGKEGAESNKTEIKVVVYDQPKIDIDKSELKTVCKPATIDISKSVSLSNEVANLTYETTYYKDASKSEELTNTKVTESGKYQVEQQFTVSAKANEATCISDLTEIPVTIDTMKVLVENVQTCPNMDATFTVNVKTNASGDVRYTWNGLTKPDPNAKSSTSATFTTMAFSDADYGDVFKYSLAVTAGTCSFEADTMTVTLGEGPVNGTMTVTEDGNAEEENSFTDTKANEFYSCGYPLTINAAYIDVDGNPITDYVWYDGTNKIGTGADLNLPENRNSGDKTYKLEFTNGCPTSVTITIHNRPISIEALSMKTIKICEGEEFVTEVKSTSPKSESPEFTWYKNGDKVVTGDGVSLDRTKVILTIDKVQTKHNGRYSVVMTNRGCTATTNVDSLVAMPYIQATEKIDTIVPRNSNPSIKLDVTVPANGKDVEYDWKGTNGERENTNPLVLNNVVQDHYYNVKLTAEDHCDATATVDIKVDAKLTLATTLKDTICTGTSAVLVIDTTGTLKMQHEDWERYLTVNVTSGGVTEDLTSSMTRDGNLLKLTVSPKNFATYEIHFHYGEQDTIAVEKVVVIPAISVTIPDPITICEGESAEIELTNISPEGTVIRWADDETIVSGDLDSPSITVEPVYKGGTSHQYQYGYKFAAINSFCSHSEDMVAYIYVDEPLVGKILGDSVICETFSSRIDASSYSATTYTWTLDGDTVNNSASMVVSPEATSYYQLSMKRGVCVAEDEFVLNVKSNPQIVAMDSVDIREREVVLADGTGEAPYTYWVDNATSLASIDAVIRDLTFNTHTAHVEDANGCRGQFVFEVKAPEIIIPDWFSPNGDGKNDGWVVAELVTVYPNAVVKIYDRFGKLIAEYLGSNAEGWDGTYNGKPMPSTDYWYVIDIEEIDRQFKGHFTLMRQ